MRCAAQLKEDSDRGFGFMLLQISISQTTHACHCAVCMTQTQLKRLHRQKHKRRDTGTYTHLYAHSHILLFGVNMRPCASCIMSHAVIPPSFQATLLQTFTAHSACTHTLRLQSDCSTGHIAVSCYIRNNAQCTMLVVPCLCKL